MTPHYTEIGACEIFHKLFRGAWKRAFKRLACRERIEFTTDHARRLRVECARFIAALVCGGAALAELPVTSSFNSSPSDSPSAAPPQTKAVTSHRTPYYRSLASVPFRIIPDSAYGSGCTASSRYTRCNARTASLIAASGKSQLIRNDDVESPHVSIPAAAKAAEPSRKLR